jgi:predicted transposase YdaD
LDKEYALERVRASSEELRAARRNLWETAKIARGFGLTLAEIAHESGFAIETVRRKLGESATPAREMMP